jgi:hypothetical protein
LNCEASLRWQRPSDGKTYVQQSNPGGHFCRIVAGDDAGTG